MMNKTLHIKSSIKAEGTSPGCRVMFSLQHASHSNDGKTSLMPGDHIYLYEDDQFLLVTGVDDRIHYEHKIEVVPLSVKYTPVIAADRNILHLPKILKSELKPEVEFSIYKPQRDSKNENVFFGLVNPLSFLLS